MAKRIRPAAYWQRSDDQVRRVAAAGKVLLKAHIKAVLGKLSELVPKRADRYAAAGDWHGVLDHLDWNHFRQVMRAPAGQIGKIREAAAQAGALQINARHASAGRPVRFRKHSLCQPRNVRGRSVVSGTVSTGIQKDAGDEFAFDLYTDEIQEQLREAQDQLIAELEQGVRDAVEQIVLNGARMGLTPDQMMDDVRQLVGLTDSQAQAVLNYRNSLESLDGDALERQLRNFLEDDTVQEALDSGQSLDAAMVDKLVQDYTDNYLDYRAETIAQTESVRAANYGLQDAYEQAIDRGVFPSDAVKQYWRIALDEKTCEICLSVADLNPNGRAMGEDFDSIDGPQDSPPAHPRCRCSVEIVTDLDLVDTSGDEEAA